MPPRRKKSLWALTYAICMAFAIAPCAFGAVTIHVAEPDADSMSKEQIIATLKNDIKLIDEQLAQCKKQKKGWTAATVIGGVGIVGTGIGAIVQNNQIQNKKSELKSAQDELRGLQ